MPSKQQAAKEALSRRKKGRFKLFEGDTTFRVMPNAKGSNYPDFVEYGMHFQVGPKKLAVRCGKKASGEGKCWLCDVAIPKLLEKADKKPALKKYADDIQVKAMMGVQIIYKDPTAGKWAGPVLFEPPGRVAEGLLGFFGRADRNYTDPNRGYNFTISRSGTDKKTRYGNLIPDEKPTKVPELFVQKLKPFGEVIAKYTDERAKAVFFGHEQEDETTAQAMAAVDEEETEAAEEAEAIEGADEATEETTEEETTEETTEEETTEETTDEFDLAEEEPAPPTKKKKPAKAAEPDPAEDEFAAELGEEAAEEVEEIADESTEATEEETAADEIPDDFDFSLEEEEAPAKKPAAKKPVATATKKSAPAPAKKPVAPPTKKPAAPPAKKPVKK